jgi:hypothetical protein
LPLRCQVTSRLRLKRSFRRQVAGLDAGDRLNVDGNAFGQPEMRLVHVRQREMGHLVHGLPVVGKISLGAVAPDHEANCSPAIAESCSPLYSAA